MRCAILALAFVCGSAPAQTTVQYIANAGVLVADGESKILFDPLFDNDYGQYVLPPADIRDAILDGTAPFDKVDAVFISHAHADHFFSSDILTLLRQQPAIVVYGSTQVADSLENAAGNNYADVFDRVIAVSLEPGDPPIVFEHKRLTIAAIRIPHSGWPDNWSDMQNIAFCVSLGGGTSVLHLGDADVSDRHYANNADYWDARRPDVAFPPYWYFLSAAGRTILDQRLKPGLAIGVHVPKKVPAGLQDVEIFTRPGETRNVSSH